MNNPAEKDAPFTSTIHKVQTDFAACGIHLTFVSEKEGLPGSWSHHLQSEACPLLTTNGKGCSAEASQASALGEFVERFATGFFFTDYALPDPQGEFFFHPNEVCLHPGDLRKPLHRQKVDKRLLTPELLEWYDTEHEITPGQLFDHNFDDLDRGIIALPFTPLSAVDEADEELEAVNFPLALLTNLYLSNGMAAGNSRHECLNQALCEIFERNVKYRVIDEAIALPDLPSAEVEKFPAVAAQIAELRKSCLVKVKDASLGGQYPVVAVLLLTADGGAFASFGCSPRLDVALSRTINEIFQGRSANTLQGFPPPTMQMERYAASENLASHFINSVGEVPLHIFSGEADYECDLTPWQFEGDSRVEFNRLRQMLENSGHTGYVFEIEGFPLPACQIVVPGMSEVYPVDELLYANRNRASWIRLQFPYIIGMKGKKLGNLLRRLEELEVGDSEYVGDLLGIVFAENTAWKRLTIGQFKAMVWLSMCSRRVADSERVETWAEVQRWSQWTAEYGMLPPGEARTYRLLSLLAGIEIEGKQEGYEEVLQAAFSHEERTHAEKIFSGAIRFPGLEFPKNGSFAELSEPQADIEKMWYRYREILQGQKKES
ncbi:YcaO-like family protein [Desulforhopalus vacuolatus]|uniref:YcaO-like family protein n=1 Tax=Desulforhopalus vacuolatus TaxID=40414 RepID=UPI001963CF27|nr:YcaO-like family protein [Desulforhopalus vacuolatus]MBM9520980.1 YcaO-like family protein [Desulforhopalus vacuolatus]